FLSYKKVFVTNFVTRITNFVTCVRNFVTSVTNFVTNFFCADSKKYQGERKKLLRERKIFKRQKRRQDIHHVFKDRDCFDGMTFYGVPVVVKKSAHPGSVSQNAPTCLLSHKKSVNLPKTIRPPYCKRIVCFILE
ncbi:MAG: hypothetical protein PUC38_03775, partial [Bacteroidales bacterium]|nr:hypothetical protein [Bacteroidales bacterium]